MDRKITLSIRLKIIAVVCAIVLVSLGLYLVVALRLFNDDKQAYVFQTVNDNATMIRTQVESYLTRLLKDSTNIYNLLVDRDLKPDEERQPLTLLDAVPSRAKSLGLTNIKLSTEKARADFTNATGSKREKLRPKLALHYLRDDNLEEAERILFPTSSDSEKVEIKNAGADWLYAAGVIYERKSRFLEAMNCYSEFSQRHTQDLRWSIVQMKLGDLKARDRQLEEANEYYKKSLVALDKELQAYVSYRMAWVEHRLGQSKKAIARLRGLLNQKPVLPATIMSALPGDVEAMAVERLDITRRVTQDFFAAFDGPQVAVARLRNLADTARKMRMNSGEDLQATTVLESKLLLRSLFFGDRDLVEFSVYEKIKKSDPKPMRLLRLVNKEYLSESDLKVEYLDRVDFERPLEWDRVTPQKPILQNSSLKKGIGLLTLIRQDPISKRYLVLRFKMDHLLAMFQNPVFTSFLADTSGNLYAHRDADKLVNNINVLDEAYIASAIGNAQTEGAREQKNNAGDDLIVAHSSLGVFNLFAFVEIRRDKAFLAAKLLAQRSIYFGLFIIFVSMIIGIAFARSLTNPIERLFRGTQVIAAGKFEERVSVQTRDEIGVLAESFNYMASRILTLLGQEKDKVRMEEELKVAKLVQDSFFPANHLRIGRLEISAFYTPAAECGGDWWGCVPIGDRIMLLIGDATGHGVPAALITATAASCCTTVRELATVRSEILNSPAEILRLLNKAVYGAAQGKILMTFFVAIVDTFRQTIVYSNASHNPPYLYKFKDREPDKKDLKPLQDAVSLRLGHKPDTSYVDATIEIASGDMMVMFTDGFIECTNQTKEEYGSRRFIKSILKSAKAQTEELRDGIVKSAMDHYAGQPLGDDLTLVCAKLHADTDTMPAPSEVTDEVENSNKLVAS